MGDRLALYGWLLFWHVLDNLDSKQALGHKHGHERKQCGCVRAISIESPQP